MVCLLSRLGAYTDAHDRNSAAGKLPVSVLPLLQVRVLLISCSVPSCRLLRLMSLSSIEYAHGLLANAAIKTVTWLRRRSTGSMRRSLQ